MKKFLPYAIFTVLIVAGISMAGGNFPLFNWPLVFDGDKMRTEKPFDVWGDFQSTGAASIALTLRLKSDLIQIGTVDPYGRTQIWNKAPNASLRLGSLEQDGDPAPQSTAEGIVIYGANSNSIFDNDDWAYARIKHNRIGLLNTISNNQVYVFRVDPTELYLRNDSNGKGFSITRSNFALNSVGVATFPVIFLSSGTPTLPTQATTKDYVDSVAGPSGFAREKIVLGVSTTTVTFSTPLNSEADTILTVNGLTLDPDGDYDFISSYVASITPQMAIGTKVQKIQLQ